MYEPLKPNGNRAYGAAAEECIADIFVTHDKQHFLGNPLFSPPDTRCRVRTAQETLEWCLQKLQEEPPS